MGSKTNSAAKGKPSKRSTECYTNGHCDVFAIALAELTGGKIRTSQATAGDIGSYGGDSDKAVLLHAWVVTPEGVAVDARGRFGEEDDLASGDYYCDAPVTMTAKALQKRFGTFPGPLAEAREFVETYRDFYLRGASEDSYDD